MQVVILAGGLATRLRPLTQILPKSLIPVCDRPFILHQFDLLRDSGLEDVLLCVGHLGEKIREVVGDGRQFGMKVVYSWEDPEALLGTGGALVNALPLLGRQFLILYGDSYLPIDYAAMADAFLSQSRPAMMSVMRNEGQWDASNVRVEADPCDGGEVVTLYSKATQPGEADCIDYGLTALKREVLERWREAQLPMDLAAVYEQLAQDGQMAAYMVTQRFYEIGKPEGLRELEEDLAGGRISRRGPERREHVR